MADRTCSIDGCDSTTTARGWCNKHYLRWKTHGDAHHERPTDMDRLLAMTRKLPGGCWEWTAYINMWGYGQIYFKGRPSFAHRVSYELHVGPIPDGMQIDHLCRNRACVNPAHLEAVTQKVNILRGQAPTAVNARKTHCDHGHELTGRNLYVRKDRPGCRQCRECSRIAKRKRVASQSSQK